MTRKGNLRLHCRKLITLAIDILLIAGSALGAWWLHSGTYALDSIPLPFTALGFLTVLAVPIFVACGFYSQIWRYASITQYLYLFVGTFLHMLTVLLILQLAGYNLAPQLVIIYWMISFILIVGVRVFYRLLANHFIRSGRRGRFGLNRENAVRVMVIGAGHAGSQIIRELLEVRAERHPVVAIDDNRNKQSLRILGVPVIGGREQIPSAVADYGIQEIILAMPSAAQEDIRSIVKICSALPCKMRILPHLTDLVNGRVSFSQTKDVEIEDLLGREPVALDTEKISGYLRGRTILVTGGGGSIGSELCRQIARFGPHRLILFDIYENCAYALQQELKAKYPALALSVLIGSVRDRARLDKVFEQYRPHVVFHAAAHKHVPLMEDSPSEAVKNNIFGTRNVAEAAAAFRASRFVLISTDKAVNPTNVMGASKRIAEMIVQTIGARCENTIFTAVRFGNVLGSNGSVIPLFKQQIEKERQVTVTDPNITRYFMTIPEAAGLVIEAGALAVGGEIFVLDMGEPVRIDDLARDLIRLSGLRPDEDVKIVYTGLRPGEKMFEELYLGSEKLSETGYDKILKMNPEHELSSIESELKTLRRIIRWDSADFKKLSHTITESYAAMIETSDQEANQTMASFAKNP